ncbi:MAG: hypothetical protein IPI66_12245 [Chitinophagaceae bacterium]|nr:hypothetical protein [Chitinophagaceae bacterium]
MTNLLLAEVRFIYDANESLLIYEEDKSHIPKDTFPDRFLEILKENSLQQLLPITVEPITETYSFFNRLKEIKVKKHTLRPSNPTRDIWKDVDEKFKEDKITNYKEVQENKK